MAGGSDKKGSGRSNREVLIEMQSMGGFVKVSAIDAATGIEVSIVGDPRYGKEMLERSVLRKLEYMLKKRGPSGKNKGIVV